MARRDLYEVLAVRQDASQDDIKKAFRQLAREYHPDLNREPDAERRFKEINLAYETLSDPAKRRQYDMFGGQGLSPDMFSFGDLGDIFEAFFGPSPFRTSGGRRTRQPRGRDLHVGLALSFEEAVFGTQKEVTLESLQTCERCSGSGAEPGTQPTTCSTCGGSGQFSDVRQSVFGTVMTSRTCPRCDGSGREIESPCGECDGEGRIPRLQEVTIEVPSGVSDGMELRIERVGDDGRDGGPPGDLYITLSVDRHPLFKRRGHDLVCALSLPVSAALLGANVRVETLDGDERLEIPAGTPPGSVVRLRGKGVPKLRGRGRGDLLVRVDVEIPDRLSRKEKQLIEEFAERRGERARPLQGRLSPPG